MIATTLSIVAVFVPVAFMGGIVGRFFYQFGIVVAFAVRCRCSCRSRSTRCCRRAGTTRRPRARPTGPVGRKLLKRFNDGFEGLGRRYRGIIHWALRHRLLTMGIAAAAFVLALALPMLGAVGGEFMPKSDEEQTMVAFELPVGSSLAYATDKGLEIAR